VLLIEVSAARVEYDVLMLWLALTLFTSIVLTLLYRMVLRSIPEADRHTGDEAQVKFVFISADTDVADELLKRAREDVDEGRLAQAVEKSVSATTNVLSQLLRYFSIDAEGMSIEDMVQSLGRSGVRLRIPYTLNRMAAILKKVQDGRPPTREEALWMVSTSGLIVEASKEARVVEG